jgi:hypothetical protein
MLLDSIMPFYHFKEFHSIVIRARTKAIITAVKDITPAEIPFMFELLWLHALPSRLFSTKKKSDQSSQNSELLSYRRLPDHTIQYGRDCI